MTREIANQVACEDVTSAKGGKISWGECPGQGGTQFGKGTCNPFYGLGDHKSNGDNKSRKRTLEMEVNSMGPNEMSKVTKEWNTHKKQAFKPPKVPKVSTTQQSQRGLCLGGS